MWSKVIQDWTTLQRSAGPTEIVQSEAVWVPADEIQDAQFLIEVGKIIVSGTNLYLRMETAPSEDEALFLPLQAPTAVNLATIGTSTVMTALAHSVYGPPVGNWVRWALESADSATWSATFRITMSAI